MNDLTIALSLSGDADVGDDYSVSGLMVITVPSGTTTESTTLTINPVDDLEYEGNETISVTGRTEGGNQVATAGITLSDNNVVPLASVTVDPETIAEEGGAVDVTIIATLSGTSGEDITIALSKVGTATQGEDYTVTVDPAAGDFVIESGMSSGTKVVTITPNDDTVDEGDETIIVEAKGSFNGTDTDEVPVTATISLVDDDFIAVIALSADESSITEDGGAREVVITAMLEKASSRLIEVALSKAGTATKDVDYGVTGEGTIVIEAGQLAGSTMLTFAPVVDQLYEGNETIEIGGSFEDVMITPTSIELVDSDSAPMFTLSVNPAIVSEEGGTQPVVLTATATVASAIDVIVGLAPVLDQSTATLIGPGADAQIPELGTGAPVIVVPAGETSGSLTLTVIPVDDDMYEPVETAVFLGVVGQMQTEPIVITIVDADAPSIALSVNPNSITEAGGAQAVTVSATLSGDPVAIPTVLPLVTAGTATKGTDYTVSGSAEIVIAAGETAGATQLTFAVMDDDVYEPGNETIEVTAWWNDVGVGNAANITVDDNYAAPVATGAITGHGNGCRRIQAGGHGQ